MRNRTMFSSTSRECRISDRYDSQARPLSATLGLAKVHRHHYPPQPLTYHNLDLTPAPPVGFNLTFQCSEDEVFDHDWFAAPFIMMTCQVRSVSPLSSLSSLNTSSYSLTEPSTSLTGLSISV